MSRRWTQEQQETLVKMYVDGEPVSVIAAELGRNESTVTSRVTALRKMGVNIERRPRASETDVAKLNEVIRAKQGGASK